MLVPSRAPSTAALGVVLLLLAFLRHRRLLLLAFLRHRRLLLLAFLRLRHRRRRDTPPFPTTWYLHPLDVAAGAAAAPPPPASVRHAVGLVGDRAACGCGRGCAGGCGVRVRTRFPPEPNGLLHIGHAKSILLNRRIAEDSGGRFSLRFDDTNPAREGAEYVEAIKRDVAWLGVPWDDARGGGLHFASDYFARMHAWAVELIRKGRAYVCELTEEEVAADGKARRPSPWRGRPVAESLRLFERMRAGEFGEGSLTLRAKVDFAHANEYLRDPLMYRVSRARHHRTGSAWCIYPKYDWAHGLEDSIEGITHSVCTLEFERHRPLYNWFINAVNEGRTEDGSGPWGRTIHHPRQIEFAKLLLRRTLFSKSVLREMVAEGAVGGWDDPRLMTLSGLRRRGCPPEAVRRLCDDLDRNGTRAGSWDEVSRLERAMRDELKERAPRRTAVLRPLKLVIENYPEAGAEEFEVAGRRVPFARELFIERDDFRAEPPAGFFRLAPGREVRLRDAYWVRCRSVVCDASGCAAEVRCTYDPETKGGRSPPPGADGRARTVRATLHWVSVRHAAPAAVRLVGPLFAADRPRKESWRREVLRGSLDELACWVEPALAGPACGDEPRWPDGVRRFHFDRLGYFCVDTDSAPGALVFNRTVTLSRREH